MACVRTQAAITAPVVGRFSVLGPTFVWLKLTRTGSLRARLGSLVLAAEAQQRDTKPRRDVSRPCLPLCVPAIEGRIGTGRKSGARIWQSGENTFRRFLIQERDSC